jgi:hypothetical protein
MYDGCKGVASISKTGGSTPAFPVSEKLRRKFILAPCENALGQTKNINGQLVRELNYFGFSDVLVSPARWSL